MNIKKNGIIKMLQEFQPKLIDRCECGAELWDGDDIRYPIWIGGKSNCDHQGINDPEFVELAKDMDEIIARINKSTTLINYYGGLNGKLK